VDIVYTAQCSVAFAAADAVALITRLATNDRVWMALSTVRLIHMLQTILSAWTFVYLHHEVVKVVTVPCAELHGFKIKMSKASRI